jgi:hypothetical protein
MTTRAAPPSPNRRRRLPGAAAAVAALGTSAFVRAQAAAEIRVQAKKRSLEILQREPRR